MAAADTGNEDSIQKEASRHEDDGHNNYCRQDTDYLESAKYWTWSTLCPLLAGTFGPMASAFSICALVSSWRVYIPDGISEDGATPLSDPHWAIALNIVSLVSAVIGNASLLLTMASRLQSSIAMPITIAGFFFASIVLIADMAALTSSNDYRITYAPAIPSPNHALGTAFYYASFAAGLYFIIASLLCLTVYGARKKYYSKTLTLTTSQRTLMLQTMSFFVYLLLGALVWSHIEGWTYLDAVYWADVTLLTVGLGDLYPETALGKGLLFPYAIGGIVVLGLVVGSIRSLVLERGEEKMAARIIEKRRETAIKHVDVEHQTIRIGIFAKARFVVRADTLPAQRRGEEFHIMRRLQALAEQERRYMSLLGSAVVTCLLWFVGAVIFLKAEYKQDLVYLDWLFFSYTSLLTIGYGTPAPQSNFGRAFFVLWSLLAVPSLTILISNMGDTVVKGISEITEVVASITVLPGERGFRATFKQLAKKFRPSLGSANFTGPGVFGDFPPAKGNGIVQTSEWENHILDRLAERVTSHITAMELQDQEAAFAHCKGNDLDRDISFYHYVLAREVRNVMKDIGSASPKQYSWPDWEYYIKLMGNNAAEISDDKFPDQDIPDILVPRQLAVHKTPAGDGLAVPELTHVQDGDRFALKHSHTWNMPWSWLSSESPLMSATSESQWIMERLSAALERELNRSRRGFRRKPPISYKQLRQYILEKQSDDSDTMAESPVQRDETEQAEIEKLQAAVGSEV